MRILPTGKLFQLSRGGSSFQDQIAVGLQAEAARSQITPQPQAGTITPGFESIVKETQKTGGCQDDEKKRRFPFITVRRKKSRQISTDNSKNSPGGNIDLLA